jgi:hypothetical protein
VQIAKDYHYGVLDNVKAGLNAALDQARDFAERKRAGEAAGDVGRQDDGPNPIHAAAATFGTQSLALTQANVATTLGYARALAGARTAAEFVELTATQSRKSCELMLKQADAMKLLGQAIVKNCADRKD